MPYDLDNLATKAASFAIGRPHEIANQSLSTAALSSLACLL